jgi:hypothetical protein
MRFVELALMSLPLALAVAWFMGARYASYRGLAVIACVLAALGGALFWMGDSRSFIGRYTPARLQDGRVQPGGGS